MYSVLQNKLTLLSHTNWFYTYNNVRKGLTSNRQNTKTPISISGPYDFFIYFFLYIKFYLIKLYQFISKLISQLRNKCTPKLYTTSK